MTLIPCSCKIRGANSEWRYASRLYLLTVSFDTRAQYHQFYLANAANIATAGGCPTKYDQFVAHDAKIGLTISSLEDGWNKESLVGMMERSNRESELVRQLREESCRPITRQHKTMHVPSRKRQSLRLHSNAFEPEGVFVSLIIPLPDE